MNWLTSLARIARVKVPQAIEDIRSAPVLHDTVVEKDEMKGIVRKDSWNLIRRIDMRWKDLLSPVRAGVYQKSGNHRTSDLRSEFEKDYHRIIGSASFRRLQDKTQVFPLDKSDFIRTRLTHSMEVSVVCKVTGTEYCTVHS